MEKETLGGGRGEGEKEPRVSLDPEQNCIALRVAGPEPFTRFAARFTYDSLPIEFRVIFQNLEEFYQFLSERFAQRTRFEEGHLVVTVNLAGRDRQFALPLQPQQLSPEEHLQQQLWQLKQQLASQQEALARQQVLNQHLATQLSETTQRAEQLSEVLADRERDYTKLLALYRREEYEPQQQEQEEGKGREEAQLQATEQCTPPKKATSYRLRKLREKEQFGVKVSFRVDPGAKYYSKFRHGCAQVQKLHGPTYQLYHCEPLPREGKFYFDIRVVQIKNNNIVVGVITDKNKDEQFSFKKLNCVCYNGYDGSICEQDKQKYVNAKPREGHKIRTVVDLNQARLEWFIIGGDSGRNPIGSAPIPPSMLKQPLFPYFELYWESNRLKLNT